MCSVSLVQKVGREAPSPALTWVSTPFPCRDCRLYVSAGDRRWLLTLFLLLLPFRRANRRLVLVP